RLDVTDEVLDRLQLALRDRGDVLDDPVAEEDVVDLDAGRLQHRGDRPVPVRPLVVHADEGYAQRISLLSERGHGPIVTNARASMGCGRDLCQGRRLFDAERGWLQAGVGAAARGTKRRLSFQRNPAAARASTSSGMEAA